MRDLLVRYLLGELNAEEEEQLQAELRESPGLQRELAYLQACLPGSSDEASSDCAPADDAPTDDAPRDLAGRTLGMICGDGPCQERPRSAAEVAAAYDAPAGTPRWSLADLTVAGGVFLAISMLFLPALRQSRDCARRTNCADNMRQIGTMLISYSEQRGGFFPTPARHENAGVFAVYLVEDNFAGDDELAELLLCRSSPLAEDVAEKRILIRVPSMCELASASCAQKRFWRRIMGGSYAYQMGYLDGDRYCAIRNESSCRKAMLADAPSEKLHYLQSANHGGGGQNVLFQDGHVQYVKRSTLPAEHQDLIYLNDAGLEAAGLDRFDTVLGRSEATPGSVTFDP